MDTWALLEYVKRLRAYQGQIVHVEHINPRAATYGDLGRPVSPSLQGALEANHLFPLYAHQSAAINLARLGRNVVVVTPAASGKTLCYNVPVIDSTLTDAGSRALYLFPTKALGQDQLRSLKMLTVDQGIKLRFASFDGDTPQRERAEIRRSAQIVVSNPDMLHLGILPNHRSWSTFLSRLRYVVIDETHSYRGVFGSHVANVMRRLRRLCAHYGSSPLFICCSATIANPREHVEKLVGLPFEVVAEDGSPSGGREFVFWNPPVVNAAKARRRSANSEATFLLTELMRKGIRSLAFVRTRHLAELIYTYVRDQLSKEDEMLARKISPYRAGYLPEERRRIERQLFEGELLAAVATTALELGVDIGALDATVLTGYPGSIASTWQQAGRSGRRRERALTFLIGQDNPLDQYFMRHPEFFFGKSHENALTSPDNLHILKPHLLCAAWEIPLREGEGGLFGENYLEAAVELEKAALLRKNGKRWYPASSEAYPAEGIAIRGTSMHDYALVEAGSGRLLETIEEATAFFEIYPGAIYLHHGEPYLVTKLDVEGHTAYCVASDAPYYTQTKEVADLKILKTVGTKSAGTVTVYLGEVDVTTTVVGFKRRRVFTEEVIGEEPLELPPLSIRTTAFWFDLPPKTDGRLAVLGLDFAGGLHAAEHASIGLLPLFALCDRNDIGGVSTPLHQDTGQAQVFIHDAHPGGTGIAEKGYQLAEELWEATLKVVSECPCEDGCPGCVQSPKCGNNNEPLDKKAAREILKWLLKPGQGQPKSSGS